MRHTLLLTALLAAPLAHAQPGTLDPSFGGVGFVTTDLGYSDVAWALALQPDGKIVVGGEKIGGSAMFLARYLPDGALDPAFGTGGIVVTDVSEQGYATSTSLALQPDGKVVVAGYRGLGPKFTMIRVLPDGALDPTFGDGGVVRAPVVVDVEEVPIALTADGKILVALNPPLGGWQYYLARFQTDGGLDGSFELVFGCCWDSGKMEDILVQPDGKILIAQRGSGNQGSVFRFHPDGPRDLSFGDGGGTDATGGNELALQPDGKIVVVSGWYCGSSCSEARIARLLPDGTLDPSFGEGGSTITSMGNVRFWDLALQPDGRIVAGGGWGDIGVARYLNDLTVATEPEPTAEGLALSAPSPHPFRGATRLTLTVPSPQPVRVALYDALGREVAVLHDAHTATGTHALTLDGSMLAPGVYVVRAEGRDGVTVGRAVRY